MRRPSARKAVDGKLSPTGPTRQIAEGRKKRKPVLEYLKRQGRFAHFAEEDIEHFQAEVDKMWDKWLIPGVIPFSVTEKDASLLRVEKTPHAQEPA